MDKKYSEEDIDALIKHMVEKRPKLVAALKSYDRPAAYLIFTGHLPAGTDLSHMGLKITEALDADQKEASRDNCLWASMVWKWQEQPSKW
ncbi:uncharacterized protein LDX57_013025 [Aspergillus melleus]|uniref:uncharacterized protein n=1 Tax=Aspergillus melleus TaxID=138277 RepID=UPI001E8D3CDD|nr:uncharacterized protein LDX57_013025 [Aspergillus melleus]KAH8435395.1 hypothetical protein LDX57_013025 [Aspergillus melleus]